MKCTLCRKSLEKPFKSFASEATVNGSFRRRPTRTVHWCESCWVAVEVQTKKCQDEREAVS